MWVAASATAIVLGFIAVALHRRRKRHDLAGRTCLVVGAAKGIGRCVAQVLSTRNIHRLVLMDINDCSETERSCRALGCKHVVQLRCDSSNEGQVQQTLGSLESSEVDDFYLVVDCVGIVSGKEFVDQTVCGFQRVVEVNLLSKVVVIKSLLPGMLQRNEGCFVGVASMMGLMGGAKLTDYCSSKFGIVGLYESLRLEFYHTNVSFLTVCPYAVDTGMFKGIMQGTRLNRFVLWLFPMLKPEQVAHDLVLAVECGSSYVVLPFLLGALLNIVRCFPEPLYSQVLILMGGRDGMRTFETSSRDPGSTEETVKN